MSSAAARVFNSCRALLAPAKASSSSSAAVATKTKPTSTKKPRAKSPAKPRTPKPPGTVRPTGILKVGPVTPALANFLGAPEASRTDAVRKIWSYIKTHNLQNPQNKKEIICDEKLRAIFDGKDVVGFLEIGKLLSRHFVKTA